MLILTKCGHEIIITQGRKTVRLTQEDIFKVGNREDSDEIILSNNTRMTIADIGYIQYRIRIYGYNEQVLTTLGLSKHEWKHVVIFARSIKK